jgi:hypothetical protein
MNCYGLNRFGPIEKKERPQNLQEKKEMEDKLAVLLADRQKQDSIWTTPGFTTPGLTNPGFANPDEKSKVQTASFLKKAEASSK